MKIACKSCLCNGYIFSYIFPSEILFTHTENVYHYLILKSLHCLWQLKIIKLNHISRQWKNDNCKCIYYNCTGHYFYAPQYMSASFHVV